MGPGEVVEKACVEHVHMLGSDHHLDQQSKLTVKFRETSHRWQTLLNLDPGETTRADKTIVGVREDDKGGFLEDCSRLDIGWCSQPRAQQP